MLKSVNVNRSFRSAFELRQWFSENWILKKILYFVFSNKMIIMKYDVVIFLEDLTSILVMDDY